jgi:hypothetical protein
MPSESGGGIATVASAKVILGVALVTVELAVIVLPIGLELDSARARVVLLVI